VRTRGADWQYPEKQQAEFDRIYNAYPNWRELMKRLDFKRLRE
jgi:hypothetical protein